MSDPIPNAERPNPSELSGRIARLERENVLMKRAAKVAALTIVAALVTAQAATTPPRPMLSGQQVGPKEIEAQRFTLVDGVGRKRAALEMTKDGPELRFLDAAGKERISVGLSERGPQVNLKDASQRTRAMLGVKSEGPTLVLADDGQVRQTKLWVGSSEMGLQLTTGGSRDIPLIELVERPRTGSLGGSKANELNLYDTEDKGRKQVFLSVLPHGDADFGLRNSAGLVVFRKP